MTLWDLCEEAQTLTLVILNYKLPSLHKNIPMTLSHTSMVSTAEADCLIHHSGLLPLVLRSARSLGKKEMLLQST